MDILFSMIVSSNVLFLLLVVFEHFNRDIFNQRQRYWILKTSLFMSIIPIAYLKPVFRDMICPLLPDYQNMNLSMHGSISTVMFTPGGFYYNSIYRYNIIIIVIWLSFALTIFSWNLWKYIRIKKYILASVHESCSPDLLNMVDEYRAQLRIKSPVKVYETNMAISPFTIRIIKPIIVIPEQIDIYKQRLIIHHELCHIKNHDGLIRFLRSVIVGIYWFNPMAYLLDTYLAKCCEFVCDEQVTTGFNKECKKAYAYLLIELAALESNGAPAYVTPLSSNQNKIKERIDLIMMNSKKSKKFAVLLSIGMVACSSFSALAYEGPQALKWEDQPSYDVFLENSRELITFTGNKKQNTPLIQHVSHESQFTDIYGNTFNVDERPVARIKCKEHTYIDGEYAKHTLNKDGSCLTNTYECQRCSKCGIMKLGDPIGEFKYTKCPH